MVMHNSDFSLKHQPQMDPIMAKTASKTTGKQQESAAGQSKQSQAKHPQAVVIKKYPNRRLYDTRSSAYVTLDDVCHMVKQGVEFVVLDAKTGEDLTRQILTQIIFEQEAKGQNLLPIAFLKQVIGYYDNSMRDFLPHYLEVTMESFAKNQDRVREYFGSAMHQANSAAGGFSPFTQLEELGKQNMELFRRTFGMFSPFDGFGQKDKK